MKAIQITFDEIDALEECFEDWDGTEEEHILPMGEDMIVTSGPLYEVTDKGLFFIEGTYFALYDGELQPDWSLTLLYDRIPECEEDFLSYLYFE